MERPDYWQLQGDKPLFPDIEWSRPEQKSHAGKLAIIGGNKLGFVAVATAYQEAVDAGAGQVRVVLPDVLKKSIPATILDAVYVASNPSGGMSRDGKPELDATADWADHILLVGDSGRNSETAMLFEGLLNSDRPMTITRDAVDLLRSVAPKMVSRPSTTLVLSFAQLQKLFQAVYYPRMLSFSMQLSLLVDALHKFTITYPCLVVTYHQNHLVVAFSGRVVTQEYDDPMRIWRGSVATNSASYQLWTPKNPFEATVTSLIR